VPNKISAARLVSALCLFVLAAGTDWVDGWYARKYDQVTKLGRVLDPFCDKVLICGTYILLAIQMALVEPHFPWWARITGLVATVVVGRELLVTVLRSMIEAGGGDFSANMSGKLKMWFQCIAVVASLLALIYVSTGGSDHASTAQQLVPAWVWWTMIAFIWLSVLSTLQSGWVYVKSASSFLLKNV
jgi:CDP-diacylglycerol--glycerol-3-phosphate 3-phosphatidyltransferase